MKKSTKKTIALSALTMLMSGSLIAGATYAWFTSSVTTKIKIQSGDIEIELHKWDGEKYKDISNVDESVFTNNADTLWEPGFTSYAAIDVVNVGTLSLKYDVVINAAGASVEDSKKLAEVIDVYFYAGGTAENLPKTRADFKNAVEAKEFKLVGTLNDMLTLGDYSVAHGDLEVNEHDYSILALHMQESATSKFEKLNAEYDITLFATQHTTEKDDFPESDYDALAGVVNAHRLFEAIENGEEEEIVLNGDIDLTKSSISGYYSEAGIELKDGKNLTIDGNNHIITLHHTAFNNYEWLEGLNVQEGIKSGTIIFKNIHFKSVDPAGSYALTLGQNSTAEVIFENCTFENMYCAIYSNGNTSGNATITFKGACKFIGTRYGYGIDPNSAEGLVTVNYDDESIFAGCEAISEFGN